MPENEDSNEPFVADVLPFMLALEFFRQNVYARVSLGYGTLTAGKNREVDASNRRNNIHPPVYSIPAFSSLDDAIERAQERAYYAFAEVWFSFKLRERICQNGGGGDLTGEITDDCMRPAGQALRELIANMAFEKNMAFSIDSVRALEKELGRAQSSANLVAVPVSKLLALPVDRPVSHNELLKLLDALDLSPESWLIVLFVIWGPSVKYPGNPFMRLENSRVRLTAGELFGRGYLTQQDPRIKIRDEDLSILTQRLYRIVKEIYPSTESEPELIDIISNISGLSTQTIRY